MLQCGMTYQAGVETEGRFVMIAFTGGACVLVFQQSSILGRVVWYLGCHRSSICLSPFYNVSRQVYNAIKCFTMLQMGFTVQSL